jgi:hypothetical protein
MYDCPTLAKDEIELLRARGLEPTLDHIAEIIDLARKVQEPEDCTFPYLSHHGVEVGSSGRFFKPMTIGSGLWYEKISMKLDKPYLITGALYMAMEHGHDESVDFSKLFSASAAGRAIEEYLKGATFTIEEASDAVDRLVATVCIADRKSDDKSSEDIEDFIAQMVALSGLPDTYWMHRTTTLAVKVMMHQIHLSAMSAGGSSREDEEYGRAFGKFNRSVYLIEQELIEASKPRNPWTSNVKGI